MTWITEIPDPDGSFSAAMLSKLQQQAKQHAGSYTWAQQAIDIQHAVDDELGATSGENIWLSPCFESGIPDYDTVKSRWDWSQIRKSSLGAPGPIHINAKALQALQVCGHDATHGGKSWSSHGHCEARTDAIMHKLLQVFPPALWILQTAGIEPDKIPVPDVLSSPGHFTALSISDIFRGFAHGRHAAHPLVPTGAKAMLSARLTVEDLFLSALESSFQDNGFYTHAARVILKGFGLDDDKSVAIDSDGCYRLRETYKLARHLPLLAPETDTQQVILFLDEQRKVVVRPFGHYGLGFVGALDRDGTQEPHRIAVIQPPHVVSPSFGLEAIACLGRHDECEKRFRKGLSAVL